jgi:glycosyltransferase involved in cell wall biosynthesis
MPVYNGERFIQQALDSLLAQDYKHFELIISDNASADRTADICRSYAEEDPRVRYYRREENSGPEANFNRVLEWAEGEYFMWAACDDLWEPSYIRTLLEYLITTPGAVLAFSAFDNIDECGHQVRTYPHLFELPSGDLFTRLQNYMAQEEYLGKANLIYGLMLRSAIQEAAGFKVWGKSLWGVDMLVVFKLLTLGNMVLSPELLFHKRLLSSRVGLLREQVRASLASTALRRVLYLRSVVSEVHSEYQQLRGYFAGYASIISTLDSLDFRHKMLLKARLWKKSNQLYLRRIKSTFVSPAIQWIRRRDKCQRCDRGV